MRNMNTFRQADMRHMKNKQWQAAMRQMKHKKLADKSRTYKYETQHSRKARDR